MTVGVGVASHQQFAELQEIEHVALVHPGELLPELDGLFPHLRRSETRMGTGRDALAATMAA